MRAPMGMGFAIAVVCFFEDGHELFRRRLAGRGVNSNDFKLNAETSRVFTKQFAQSAMKACRFGVL